MRFALVALLLAFGTSAFATPLNIRNGRSINMVVAGQRKAAIGLGAARDGWRISLERTATGVVELADVTRGTPVGRQNVRVVDGAVLLPPGSFTPGHAYAAKLRTGTGQVFDALIYLYPPRNGGKVVFGDEERGSDDTMGVTEKGLL